MGWCKLNVDGSMKNNILGAGGVIRTDQGVWILGFTKFIGVGPIDLAEAWALQIGLEIASSLNFRRIEIELDCQEVFNLLLLLQFTGDTHPLAIILLNCKHFLQCFEEYRVSKVFRAQNTCADALAKEATDKLLPLRTYHSAPSFVNEYYVLDLLGC